MTFGSYNIIIKRFGQKYNFMNNVTVAKFKFNGNFTVLKWGAG